MTCFQYHAHPLAGFGHTPLPLPPPPQGKLEILCSEMLFPVFWEHLDTHQLHKQNIARMIKFVYVIGLHAVQFGNNWMKKIPRIAKIGRGRRPSPIWLSEDFFNPVISKLDKHVVLLLINYIASQLIQHCQQNYNP